MKIFQIFPGITPNIHKHKLATFPATNHRRDRLNVASNLRSARYNLVAPTIKSAIICSATSHTKRSLSNSIFTKVVPQKNVKCHTTELFLMRQLSCHLSKEPVSRSGLLPPSARWIVVVTRSDDLPGFSAKYSGCPWLQLPGPWVHDADSCAQEESSRFAILLFIVVVHKYIVFFCPAPTRSRTNNNWKMFNKSVLHRRWQC